MRAASTFLAAGFVIFAACGSTDEDHGPTPRAGDDKATLDACGLPTPCDQLVHSVYAPDPKCVLPHLEQRQPIHISTRFMADGGDCVTNREIYAGADGVAMVWALGGGAHCDTSYTLERCTLKPPEFFAACSAEPFQPTSPSDCHGDWFESCTPIETPECP